MKRLGLALAGALLAACSHAPGSFTDGVQLAETARQHDAYPPRVSAFAGGVSSLADVAYARPAGFRPLTLDLYLPPRPATSAGSPLIIFVHGGGWAGGHARANGAFTDFPAVLARFAARGYAVASVNYRLSGEARFPAPLDDLRAAIRWLREQAGNYHIDIERVALWGASAGAHLAALAALECQADCPQVLVAWYGVHQLQALRDTPGYLPIKQAAGRLLDCQLDACSQATVRDASPVYQVPARAPAALLIHGDADPVVPYQQTLLLADALRTQQGRVDTLIIPGVGHSLVGVDQAATEAANRMALEATLRFLGQSL